MTHLTGGEIETFVAGTLSQASRRNAVAHLLSGCVACRARLATFRQVLFPEAVDLENNTLKLEQSIERRYERAVQRAWMTAQAGLPEILKQQALLEELWAASTETRYREPSRMEELTHKAVQLANGLSSLRLSAGVVADLQARAWAEYGNALRVNEKLEGAEQALTWARQAAVDGSGDPLLAARLADLEASLRVDQRRLDEGKTLLQEALEAYRDLGEDHLVGRTLISMGNLAYYDGDLAQATALTRQGLELVETGRDPILEAAGEKNLIVFVAESGRYCEAAELLLASGLRQRLKDDVLTLTRLRWIEGKIAAGLGRLDRASRIFETAREEFIELGRRSDAAFAALDLAAVWLRQGRLAELRVLAEGIFAVLSEVGIGVEAVQALSYLREACCAQKPPLSAIISVRDFLVRHEFRPELVFKPA